MKLYWRDPREFEPRRQHLSNLTFLFWSMFRAQLLLSLGILTKSDLVIVVNGGVLPFVVRPHPSQEGSNENEYIGPTILVEVRKDHSMGRAGSRRDDGKI